MRLTSLIFGLRGKYELMTTIPPSLRSEVSPVVRLIAPPWLKPPMMTRSGAMPDSTSAEMSSFRLRAERRMPCSSSTVLPNATMSYLAVW